MFIQLACKGTRRFSTFSNGIGWGVTIPQLGGSGAVAVTKYRITRPYKDDTTWDDFLIALPERDQLAKFSKDIPLFIRYLKLVTDKEGRSQSFKDFFMRCKDGLTVENDVFINTDELLAVMWKNGYSEQERNAIQFTFPADYRFHYPELAVLFDVAEDDAYKFCMRCRMDKSHIGELDYSKVKRKGLLRDHWLLYAGGWYVFKNYPFFSYVFFLKTWGFTVWFASCWYLFGRMATQIWRRNEQMQLQKTAEGVMEGEDAIVSNMRKFAHDSSCVGYLKNFKNETQSRLAGYRAALVKSQKQLVTERMNAQLQAIARMESSFAGNLQEMLINETARTFKDNFVKDSKLQDTALTSAIASLRGGNAEKGASTGAQSNDPVMKHFLDALKMIEKAEWSKVKGNSEGNIVERLAFIQNQNENEFKRAFYVEKSQVEEIRKLAAKAKSGSGFDWTKLDAADAKRLDELYVAVNNKVGFVLPHEKNVISKLTESSDESAASAFVNGTNQQLQAIADKLRNERLTAFASAF